MSTKRERESLVLDAQELRKRVAQTIQKNTALLTAHRDSFYRTFNRRLESFFHPLLGFDVILFDERFIKPQDGESTAQAVERIYGQDALELVYKLLV